MIYELPRDILVHGIFSTRKTSVAMTASKDYPPLPAVAPFAKPVILSDVALIAWDSQAGLTLPHLGIELAPDSIFETTGRLIPTEDKGSLTGLEPESIVETINASRKWAVKRAKAGAKFFIHDTVSTKDSKIVGFWTKLIEDDPKAGKDTAQKLYRNVLKTHIADMEFFQNLAAYYKCFNIWNCHTTIKGQDAPSTDPKATAATNIQRQARGMLGAELAARITGQSWNYFMENCRMVFYQTLEQEFGKEQAFWTTRSNELAVKPGLPENVLPSKLRADFRTLFNLAAGTTT